MPMDVAPRYAGVAGAFISTAAGIAAVISPAAFGFVTDLTGSYLPPFSCRSASCFGRGACILHAAGCCGS